MSTHEAKTTKNLKEIQKWAEDRKGKPAIVKTKEGGKNGGILRIDFPGYSGENSLETISWEEWYEIFQNKNLSFLYQEQTSDGKESRFFKLIDDDKK